MAEHKWAGHGGLVPLVVGLLLIPMSVRAQARCAADCNGNGVVTVGEVITAVNIALGLAEAGTCKAADRDGDGRVAIDELIRAVRSALDGCGIEPPPEAVISGTAQAGDLGQRAGVVSYRYQIRLEREAVVELVGESAASRGTIGLEWTAGTGMSATLQPVEGGAVMVSLQRVLRETSPGVAVRLRLQRGSPWFEMLATGPAEPADPWVQDLVFSASLGPDTTAPPVGELVFGADGAASELAVVRNGEQVVSDEALASWFAETGAAELLDDTEVTRLLLVLADKQLADALRGELEGVDLLDDGFLADPNAAVPFIHTSPLCAELFGAAGIVAGICCGACVGGVAAIPITAGGSTILSIPSCPCCLAALGISLADVVACVVSRLQAIEEEDCANRCSRWQVGHVTRDEHDCLCQCDGARCTAFCRDLAFEAGAQYCGDTGCLDEQCRCRICSDEICMQRLSFPPGEQFCFSECRDGRCTCVTCSEQSCLDELGAECCDVTCNRAERRCLRLRAQCGDGVVTTSCRLNPDSAEECDGSGRAQCEEGFVCEACRCVRACGNGRVDEGEECDGPGRAQCPEGEACVGCRCSPDCGNGRVDEGETCDPPDPTDADCDGIICTESCQALIRTPSCGDGCRDATAGEECDGDDDARCPGRCGEDCRCAPAPTATPAFDFRIDVLDSPQEVVAGQTAEYRVVLAVEGEPKPIEFTVTAAIPNASWALVPEGSLLALRVVTSKDTPAGSYTLTVRGTYGDLVREDFAVLLVRAAAERTPTPPPGAPCAFTWPVCGGSCPAGQRCVSFGEICGCIPQ